MVRAVYPGAEVEPAIVPPDSELKRSWEYASWIIEAREKDAPVRIHGNVMNNSEKTGARGRATIAGASGERRTQ